MIDFNAPITEESVKQNRQKWTDALRSGEYKQGKNRLRTKDGRLCCLGVLCEIAGVKRRGAEYWHKYRAYVNLPPVELLEQVGLAALPKRSEQNYRNACRELAHKNDSGVPFTEIADFIETLPITLPTP